MQPLAYYDCHTVTGCTSVVPIKRNTKLTYVRLSFVFRHNLFTLRRAIMFSTFTDCIFLHKLT